MKLPKITTNDPMERLAVSVRRSTNEMIDAYRAAYKETHGDEVERSHMVEEILRRYMLDDKDFVRRQEAAAKNK